MVKIRKDLNWTKFSYLSSTSWPTGKRKFDEQSVIISADGAHDSSLKRRKETRNILFEIIANIFAATLKFEFTIT